MEDMRQDKWLKELKRKYYGDFLHPSKISFETENEIKTFSNKHKLRELIPSPSYQKKCQRLFFRPKEADRSLDLWESNGRPKSKSR